MNVQGQRDLFLLSEVERDAGVTQARPRLLFSSTEAGVFLLQFGKVASMAQGSGVEGVRRE